MSRIEINADGRHIVVDHDSDLDTIKSAALDLWNATNTPRGTPSTAVGFNTQLAPQWDHDRKRPVRAEVAP